MDQLLNGAFPLLGNRDLRVIKAYGMDIDHGGGDIVAAMGYVIVDAKGVVRDRSQDPLFGQHAATILRDLRAIQ